MAIFFLLINEKSYNYKKSVLLKYIVKEARVMHNIVSKLLIYGDMPKDSILMELSDIIREYKSGDYKKDEIITRIYNQIKRILEVSTDYAFDKNLWHNYLTYLLITNENPFSLTCEKVGASVGTVNSFAKNDFKQFKALFVMTLSQWRRAWY